MRLLGVALLVIGVALIVLRRPLVSALRSQSAQGLTGAPPAGPAAAVYWCICVAWLVLGALLAFGVIGGG
jgi:hypothetical protein